MPEEMNLTIEQLHRVITREKTNWKSERVTNDNGYEEINYSEGGGLCGTITLESHAPYIAGPEGLIGVHTVSLGGPGAQFLLSTKSTGLFISPIGGGQEAPFSDELLTKMLQ